jgi:hypothetical protein
MRSFDRTDDLKFEIGGETFQMHTVRPEVIDSWPKKTPSDQTYLQALGLIDGQIKEFLSADDHPRWDALRARETDAVTFAQMNDVLTWMVEVQTGRPTQPPSPSADSPGTTEPSSTEESP